MFALVFNYTHKSHLMLHMQFLTPDRTSFDQSLQKHIKQLEVTVRYVLIIHMYTIAKLSSRNIMSKLQTVIYTYTSTISAFLLILSSTISSLSSCVSQSLSGTSSLLLEFLHFKVLQ